MAEFAYNNAKNASTGYILFKLDWAYYFYISYEKSLDLRSKSSIIEKISFKLKKLMIIC